jgi:hypothetical protein
MPKVVNGASEMFSTITKVQDYRNATN